MDDPESIADHMYICFLIGLFFLPNDMQECFEYNNRKTDYKGYCKETV